MSNITYMHHIPAEARSFSNVSPSSISKIQGSKVITRACVLELIRQIQAGKKIGKNGGLSVAGRGLRVLTGDSVAREQKRTLQTD